VKVEADPFALLRDDNYKNRGKYKSGTPDGVPLLLGAVVVVIGW